MIFKAGTSLIGSNGRPVFGLYKYPLKDLSLDEYRPHGSNKNKPKPGNLKKWIFCGVVSENFVFGAAIVNIGYLSNLFSYLFDRKTKKIYETSALAPAALGTSFDGSSKEGRAVFDFAGSKASCVFSGDKIALNVSTIAVKADFNFTRVKEPLCLLSRIGLKGFNYTEKESSSAADGVITAGGSKYNTGAESSGIIDYTVGLLARTTFWNWAAGSGRAVTGERISFNLSQGVNETGFTENAFWVNGSMVKVDTVDFIYNDRRHVSEWEIRSYDGKIKLFFTAEGERKADIKTGFMSSFFHQPFGSFRGTLDDGAKQYEIKEAYGFTEEHEAVW